MLLACLYSSDARGATQAKAKKALIVDGKLDKYGRPNEKTPTDWKTSYKSLEPESAKKKVKAEESEDKNDKNEEDDSSKKRKKVKKEDSEEEEETKKPEKKKKKKEADSDDEVP